MNILGAVMIVITAKKDGQTRHTKQLCCVGEGVKGWYVSHFACTDLSEVLPWSNKLLEREVWMMVAVMMNSLWAQFNFSLMGQMCC